jgi:hypothetical protein
MKVMIEVDIPAHGSKAEAEMAVKRHFDPDWIASWWHISDVHCCANDWDEDDTREITDEEAAEVLRLAEKHHNSELGINWDVLDNWIDHVKAQRKEKA